MIFWRLNTCFDAGSFKSNGIIDQKTNAPPALLVVSRLNTENQCNPVGRMIGVESRVRWTQCLSTEVNHVIHDLEVKKERFISVVTNIKPLEFRRLRNVYLTIQLEAWLETTKLFSWRKLSHLEVHCQNMIQKEGMKLVARLNEPNPEDVQFGCRPMSFELKYTMQTWSKWSFEDWTLVSMQEASSRTG